jgi:uncharacterized protein (DUF433 family)
MYQGTGVYSPTDAARLINVPAYKIKRWLFGYDFSRSIRGEKQISSSPPLWMPQIAPTEFDTKIIGFNDLLEIRFVDAFVRFGLPLTVVRRCLNTAKELYKIDFPLTSGKFKTDGKTIFAQAIEQARDEDLLDLRNKQFAFNEIFKPSLYAGIEYEGNLASKWYPNQKDHEIVLDPKRQFGTPIVDEVNIPTSAIYSSYLSEGADSASLKTTSNIFDIPEKLVASAIKFETGLLKNLH